ncbi:putative DD41D transposase [Trichonephila clavipes]|nr:putative DD41D transposase [Trichonephila clavipes]
MTLKQSEKVRNGSQKIHRKPKTRKIPPPNSKQCLLDSSMLGVLSTKNLLKLDKQLQVLDLNAPMSDLPKWFEGSKLNFAENLLRYRNDDVAIIQDEKLTVWCALWAGGIIGPYFFKNDEGYNVTVNGDRYRAMITNFFIPELNNHDVQELWFQQDGATCHTARATIDLLKDTFGDRLISRFGPVNWPPRSCDLTPLDYFLWGYVKSLVYANRPQTLDPLEDNIRRVIADIRPQMLEKVIENWTSRLDHI